MPSSEPSTVASTMSDATPLSTVEPDFQSLPQGPILEVASSLQSNGHPTDAQAATTNSMTESGAIGKSASFMDVRSVEDANGAPPLKRSKLSTVVNLLEARKAMQVRKYREGSRRKFRWQQKRCCIITAVRSMRYRAHQTRVMRMRTARNA